MASTTSAKKTNETTLTHLTKRFVRLLNSSSDRVINLNEASSRLSVAKRRIYDITNVLEGIGLLQKTSKNVTRWIDCSSDNPLAAPTHGIMPDAEMTALLKTHQSLEEGVKHLEAKIRQQLNAEAAYVTYNDIKSYFNDQIVIAVKAPPETRLEVNESLQIWMKSEHGKIEVYLCPQQGYTSPHLQQSQQFYTDPTSGYDDNYNNDPTLSSALSTEDEDPFKLFEAREDTQYNFMLDDNYTISSLFPEDNLY